MWGSEPPEGELGGEAEGGDVGDGDVLEGDEAAGDEELAQARLHHRTQPLAPLPNDTGPSCPRAG